MSGHLKRTLIKLSTGSTQQQSGFHFGSLKALAVRGLAEKYRSEWGSEWRISEAGIKFLQEAA